MPNSTDPPPSPKAPSPLGTGEVTYLASPDSRLCRSFRRKAQTRYRANTIHQEAEHEKNPQHRTASNHGSKPRKHPSDRKIALFKIRIYFSIPVKPHFSIDSKQLIKIQFYSPKNDSFSILVFQYSSTPPSVAVGPGLTIQKCKTKALPIKRRAFAVRENGTKLYNSGHILVGSLLTFLRGRACAQHHGGER